jgi:hypothetical protein
MKHVGQKPSGFSPTVEDLVAHERVPPALPEDVRARLVSRAEAAILEGTPETQRATRPRAGQSIAVGKAAVAVAAGIAAAIYLFAGSAPSPPVAKAPVSAKPPASAPPEPTSPTISGSDPAPVAPSAHARPVETPVTSARPTVTSRQEGSPEEIQLLSRARQADARRDYPRVLSVLSEHERNFPSGRLAEEREVLRVKALVGLGRTDQARRTAARFRRQFPRSVLLHRVDEMLASRP